jgi:hypothetical protein
MEDRLIDRRPLGSGRVCRIAGGGVVRYIVTHNIRIRPTLTARLQSPDRKKGDRRILYSQILPLGDPRVLGLWFDVEAQICEAIGA